MAEGKKKHDKSQTQRTEKRSRHGNLSTQLVLRLIRAGLYANEERGMLV